MAVERIELGKKDVEPGCACCAAPSDASPAPDEAEVEVIRVAGMTCAHCVASVSEELSAVEGVVGVDIGLVPGGASEVRIRRAAPLDPQAIDAAVREAGYSVLP